MLYPRFPLLNGASEDFRDLHCIECGAFTDLVAHYPQVECVGKNKVFTNPTHEAIILAGSVEWDRKRFVRNIVDDLNASSVSISRTCCVCIYWPVKFRCDGDRVRPVDWYSNAGT